MPRAEVGSQKWLANKMKSKGLQKLKWYCQMCEKQCRDENGFKCHRLSEGHQRMMQVFCQNSGRFMDGFSRTFENEFMKLMRTRYCKTKIMANTVYQELISDKQHVHMNATIWVTLSEFVLYLGRSGKCKVEHTPKGWYIEYIDQELLNRRLSEQEKEKREEALERKHDRLIQKLIEEGRKRGDFEREEYTPLMKDESEKIVIAPKFTDLDKKESGEAPRPKDTAKGNVFKSFYQSSKTRQTSPQGGKEADKNGTRKKSELELLMELNQKRYKRHRDESEGHSSVYRDSRSSDEASAKWVCKDITVKVILKSHEMYKRKFKVLYTKSEVAVLDGGNTTLEVPEKYLETVVPRENGRVKVLAGKNKGLLGTLVSSDPDNLKAKISIQGNVFEMGFDDFSEYNP